MKKEKKKLGKKIKLKKEEFTLRVKNRAKTINDTRKNITHHVKKRVQKVNEKRREVLQKLKIKQIKTANILTLLNASFGLACIFLAIRKESFLAVIMLLLAAICDFLDGKVARLWNQTSDLGKELDSLADIVSFGVAPAVFAFTLYGTWLAILAYIIFLCCGIIRLAKFNIQETTIYFYGMPITTNGYIIPLIYFLQPPAFAWPIIFIPLAILMVSKFKIKKLK